MQKILVMPQSKEFSQREMIIDRLLSGGKEYTGEQLMNAVNRELDKRGMQNIHSRATFAADINEINSKWWYRYSKDIIRRERRGRQFVYYYSEPGSSIFKRGLSKEDISAIHNMISTFRRFKGMPQFPWLEQLEVRFDQAVLADDSTTVAFDDSYNENAMKPFEALLNAITKRQVIDIDYRRFADGKPTSNIISPYYLKQYGLRWYLLASYKGKTDIYTFALDRIHGVEVKPDETYQVTNVDFNHYFDNIIGVTNYTDQPIEHVEIWVSSSELPYILTKPLHHTQQLVSENEEGAIISIDVSWNYELEQTIFAYGDALEVMKPVSLRKKLKDRVERLLAIYQSERPGE